MIKGKKKEILKVLISIFLSCIVVLGLLSIVGCGGSGGGSSSDDTQTAQVRNGVFVDSPVEGLGYETASQSGFTDSAGTFSYKDGETITFSIGDLILESGTPSDTMTPVDLVAGATNETNTTVTNICRLILSLDVDGDPENGITITEEIRDAVSGYTIDFTQSTDDFSNDPNIQSLFDSLNELGVFTDEGERTLCTAGYAQSHLKETLDELSGEPTDTETGNLPLKVILGPIVEARVNVYPLTDTSNLIASGVTEGSDDLDEAGKVSLDIPDEYDETTLYVTVEGGEDIDANDDGVRDDVATVNDITLEFVFPTPDDIKDLQIVANPLLIFASGYVLENVWRDEAITDPEEVRTIIERVAKALISEDVNGDETIDWKDIVCFNPLTDQAKSRIPWGYVLDNIERKRNDYGAELVLIYAYMYLLDPQSQQPFDLDENGYWTFEDYESYSYYIWFFSNKNNYTTQDLLEGQGSVGGSVSLPGNSTITYQYYFINDEGETEIVEVDNDPEPSLLVGDWIIEIAEEVQISAFIGGDISDPLDAPAGEYTINYNTGDGQEHQEKLYLHENKSESLFYGIPEFEIDQDGFIVSIQWRFEDREGNVLEESPILYGTWAIDLWDSIDQVNEIVRGQNYYSILTGYDSEVDRVFIQYPNCISITEPVYPTNNGHNIYYEDLYMLFGTFVGGDGVNREFYFFNNRQELFPQLSNSDLSGDNITVEYSPSDHTGREVVSIRYKFDNSDWAEVTGSSVTLTIPDGATVLYATAKDTSGFYRYPPNEVDLTQ